MKGTAKPMRSTIVWGLISGLVYIPLMALTHSILPWPLRYHLVLWALWSGYSIFLCRWAFKQLPSIVLPTFLMLLTAFFIQSTTAFTFMALVLLSWIRSGICFNRTPAGKRLAAEIGLGLGTGLAVSAVLPAATLTGALGVWLFFLIQALYFVLFEYHSEPTTRVETDPFEKAKMAAEQILFH
jgi:hypothetical protein